MPSPVLTKNNYRKAKCCGTCRREQACFCGLLGVRVRPDMVCDRHLDDQTRAGRKTRCTDCAFGPNGDHTCTVGCAPGRKKDAACWVGKPRPTEP